MGRFEIGLLAALLVYGWIFGYLAWDLVVGVVVYAICVLIVGPFALWKLKPGLAEERTITVSEAGISVVSETTSRQEEWASYKWTKERSEYYALRKTTHQATTILLKRFFEDGNEEAELRAILSAHTKAHLSDVPDEA